MAEKTVPTQEFVRKVRERTISTIKTKFGDTDFSKEAIQRLLSFSLKNDSEAIFSTSKVFGCFKEPPISKAVVDPPKAVDEPKVKLSDSLLRSLEEVESMRQDLETANRNSDREEGQLVSNDSKRRRIDTPAQKWMDGRDENVRLGSRGPNVKYKVMTRLSTSKQIMDLLVVDSRMSRSSNTSQLRAISRDLASISDKLKNGDLYEFLYSIIDQKLNDAFR